MVPGAELIKTNETKTKRALLKASINQKKKEKEQEDQEKTKKSGMVRQESLASNITNAKGR